MNEYEDRDITQGTRPSPYTREELEIIKMAKRAAETTPPPESPDELRRKRLGMDTIREWMGPKAK